MEKVMFEAEAEETAASIAGQLKDLLASFYPKFADIWNETWGSEECLERKKLLDVELLDLTTNWLEDLLVKETKMREELIVRVESLLEEIARLEKDLNTKISLDDVKSLPLQSMAKQLLKKAEPLRAMKALRLNKLAELQAQEISLAEALGEQLRDWTFSAVPTNEQLESYQRHIQELENEKRTRLGVFIEQRQRIVELHKKLASKPTLLFEKEVVMDLNERNTNFKVTNENMRELQNLLKRLEHEAEVAAQRRDYLLKILLSLWEYLEEPEEQRESFLKENSGFTKQDLDALEAELERCKQEKILNIQKFVLRIRKELVDMWDKCMVSDHIRDQFRVFRVTYFNEDVYDLHEQELKRWQDYYTINHSIFELYKKQCTLFEKLLELNGCGKSADRYRNRGGQLLQEEKQRKMVSKELPRVESDLRAALEAYANNNGEPFYCFNRPLIEVINEKWEAKFDEKAIQKFRHGVVVAAQTPLGVKRRAETPVSTGGKMSKLAVPTPIQPARSARRRIVPADRNNKQPEPDSTIQLEPSYEDFHKTFSSKLGTNKLVSRSTEVLTPRRVLRERTQPIFSSKSSPVLNTPKMIPPARTPKTVPRRGRPADQPKTPRNRLACIL